MNSATLLHYFKPDQSLKKKDLKTLDRLLDQHPYFQLGMAIKSMYLKKEEHIDYLKTSRKTAILFPDRDRLNRLITESNSVSEPFESADSEESNKNFVEKQKDLTHQAETVEKPESKNALADQSAEDLVQSEEELIHSEEERVQTEEELEKSYFTEAVNQSIQLETTPTLADEVDVDSELRHAGQVLSFTEWLSGHKSTAKEDQTLELINRFIAEEPVISPVKKGSFYSPVEKGKKSISDENMPVSETLANVFLAQGNTAMAANIYRQLMLANPEKSSYFAVLIKKLKEK